MIRVVGGLLTPFLPHGAEGGAEGLGEFGFVHEGGEFWRRVRRPPLAVRRAVRGGDVGGEADGEGAM